MKNIKKYALALFLISPSVFALGLKDSKAARAIKNPDKAQVISVRKEAKENSDSIGQIKDSTEYEIIGAKNSWLEIDFNGQNGFVNSYWFDQVEDTKTISPANFRKEASLDSEIYEVLEGGRTVTVLDVEDNGFVKVKYNGKTGYISLDLLELYNDILKAQEDLVNSQAQIKESKQTYTANNYQANRTTSYNNNYSYGYINNNSYSYGYAPSSSNNSGKIVSASTSGIYSFASQFVGNRYVWGGNSLTNGTDCSGFTQSVYSKYGVKLPHNAQAQYAYGKNVQIKDAKEGDLVFYGTSANNITHVAIADGKGGIVHAANPSTGIVKGNIGNPIGIKRVAEEKKVDQPTPTTKQNTSQPNTETSVSEDN
ncbi:MAG: NlpC/P60 family protein [Peptoniphilaceae bacterium]|nr:NlpC/P60 family protein [Peptoniphilaceae bacterium]MDY6018105.1 NlpC/P60 family protein [Anaerococcus sp.]